MHWETNEKDIRHVLKPSAQFAEPLQRKEIASGVAAIFGKLKSDSKGHLQLQSFQFSRSKFNPNSAKQWVAGQKNLAESFADFRLPGVEVKLSYQDAQAAVPNKIQILRAGKYHHPVYGEFEIKASDISKMKENFDKKIRGVDLALDFAHESHLEAAAWILALHPNSDNTELWADVTWTPKGQAAVLNREYRYVSADFVFNFQNNETLESFGPTLNGAALTNRPVIKEMAPVIELSEGGGKSATLNEDNDDDETKNGKDREEMDKDKLIEDLKAEVASLKSKSQSEETKLSEANKKIEALEAEKKKLDEEKKLAEKKADFDKLLAEGKAVEAQRDPFVKGDMVEFVKLAQPVKLSDTGHGGDNDAAKKDGDKSAQDQVLEKAQVILSEKKANDIGAAISMVLKSEKTLAEAYAKEMAL